MLRPVVSVAGGHGPAPPWLSLMKLLPPDIKVLIDSFEILSVCVNGDMSLITALNHKNMSSKDCTS